MRITNRYTMNRVLQGIQGNMSQLSRSQEQIAAESKLLRLSDEPSVISQFMSINATLSYNEQYNRNINDGLAYLETADTALGTIGVALTTAKELTLEIANDSYNAFDRQAAAQQIDKIVDQILDLANASVGDKYVFAGTNSDQAPFYKDNGKIMYRGNLDVINREVMAGTLYQINEQAIATSSGDINIFGVGTGTGPYELYNPGPPATGEGVFKVLYDLKDRLDSNDEANFDDSLDKLDEQSDKILQRRTAVGARWRHFDSLKTQLANIEVTLTQNLKNVEGADIAKLSLEAAQQKLCYEASLAMGAKLMSTSLLDFLR